MRTSSPGGHKTKTRYLRDAHERGNDQRALVPTCPYEPSQYLLSRNMNDTHIAVTHPLPAGAIRCSARGTAGCSVYFGVRPSHGPSPWCTPYRTVNVTNQCVRTLSHQSHTFQISDETMVSDTVTLTVTDIKDSSTAHSHRHHLSHCQRGVTVTQTRD